jgi:hypothetical protein
VADLNFQFGNNANQSKAGSLAGRIFLCLFATPFAAFGLFAFWSAIKKLTEGKTHDGCFLLLFGVVFSLVGFGLMYAAITAARREKLAEEKWRTQTDGGSEVWLARSDWAAGKIKSTFAAQSKILLIMGLAFCGIGGVFTFAVIKQELPKGNYLALLVLIFPLAGLGLLVAFGRSVLQQRRFGQCTFELAQIPAPLGGTLDGLIQTERPLRLEQGLHLKLTCVNCTESGSGKDRRTQESILWQDEKVFRADASLPATGLGGNGIPVHFKLPINQPESSLRGNSTIVWRLEAKAKMAGPDFTAMFELPVFRVAGIVAETESDIDPTAPLQMSAEEIRRDEHSKIQVNQVSGGREFYFPAARNVGAAILTTVFTAVTGVGAFLVSVKGLDFWLITMLGAGILCFFSIVFGIVSFNLWFKSCRVLVNSSGLAMETCWLFIRRARKYEAADILELKFDSNASVNNKALYRILLVTNSSQNEAFAARKARYQQTGKRPPMEFKITGSSGVTLASGVASKLEADWLVREMTHALGRQI